MFFDSFNIQSTSLAEMGNTIGIRKESEKIQKVKNTNLEITKNVLEYSLMDVVILKESILFYPTGNQ